MLHAVQHRLYRHGDRRDDWLRGPSRSFVEDVLLSPRLADHGVFRPDAVRALVAEHMTGGSLGSQLGLVLAGRAVAAVVRGRRSSTGRQALVMRIIVFGHNDWWVWQRQGFCTRNAALVRGLAARDEVAGAPRRGFAAVGPADAPPGRGSSRGGLRRRAQDPRRALRVRAAAAVHVADREARQRAPRVAAPRAPSGGGRPRRRRADGRLGRRSTARRGRPARAARPVRLRRDRRLAPSRLGRRGDRQPRLPSGRPSRRRRVRGPPPTAGAAPAGRTRRGALQRRGRAAVGRRRPGRGARRAARTARGLRRHDPAPRGRAAAGRHHAPAARDALHAGRARLAGVPA